jgi:hypothetical protein
VLGWSYIFSARLIETRRRTVEDQVVYTDNLAQSSHNINTGEYFDLDIGCDSVSAVRWWAAVLVGGRGWQATLSREDGTYFSPWEFHLSDSHFRIYYYKELPSSFPNLEAPSLTEA